jgi:riboflavin synthase
MVKIGLVDTMFSRVNMGEIAIDELKEKFPDVEFIRKTVPGVKDLPVECKKLLTGDGELETPCDSCMALGMVGGAPVDQVCAHEASLGIQEVKLLTNKHVIEVFVHENEAWSESEFFEICNNRVRKHVENAVEIITNPEKLIENAGKGIRQGKEDEGSVSLESKEIGVAIVVSEFNKELTDEMEKKALETIDRILDTKHKTTLRVAGVFDMPLAVKKLLMDKLVNAVVVLGAVIKGDTAHDEVIVKNTARSLQNLSLEFNKPIGLGIIGHDVGYDEAAERADEYAKRAVDAAVSLAKVLRS